MNKELSNLYPDSERVKLSELPIEIKKLIVVQSLVAQLACQDLADSQGKTTEEVRSRLTKWANDVVSKMSPMELGESIKEIEEQKNAQS